MVNFGEIRGRLFCPYARVVASVALGVGSVISSTVLPTDCSAREALSILKERYQVLGLFGKSGSSETTTLLSFLAQFLGGSQVYLVDGK